MVQDLGVAAADTLVDETKDLPSVRQSTQHPVRAYLEDTFARFESELSTLQNDVACCNN